MARFDWSTGMNFVSAVLLAALLIVAIVGLRLLRRALLALTQISVAERQNSKRLVAIHDELEKFRRGR